MIRASTPMAAAVLLTLSCGGPTPSVPPAPTATTPRPAATLASPAVPAALLAQTDAAFLHLYGGTRMLTLGVPRRVTLSPDGRTALFLRSQAHDAKQSLYELDVVTGAVRELLAPDALDKEPEHLTLEERALRERMRITAVGFTAYELSKDGAGGRVAKGSGNATTGARRSTTRNQPDGASPTSRRSARGARCPIL